MLERRRAENGDDIYYRACLLVVWTAYDTYAGAVELRARACQHLLYDGCEEVWTSATNATVEWDTLKARVQRLHTIYEFCIAVDLMCVDDCVETHF